MTDEKTGPKNDEPDDTEGHKAGLTPDERPGVHAVIGGRDDDKSKVDSDDRDSAFAKN